MSGADKVRVVVRSHRVPARTFEFSRPVAMPSGFFLTAPTERGVVYESVLDDSQLRAIDEAKRLAADLGLPFEVFDEAKANPLRRAFSKLVPARRREPSLTLTKSWPRADLRRARSPISAPAIC